MYFLQGYSLRAQAPTRRHEDVPRRTEPNPRSRMEAGWKARELASPRPTPSVPPAVLGLVRSCAHVPEDIEPSGVEPAEPAAADRDQTFPSQARYPWPGSGWSGATLGGNQAARPQLSANTSACSRTVSVAFSCLSGG